jgi:hypothetical protein
VAGNRIEDAAVLLDVLSEIGGDSPYAVPSAALYHRYASANFQLVKEVECCALAYRPFR